MIRPLYVLVYGYYTLFLSKNKAMGRNIYQKLRFSIFNLTGKTPRMTQIIRGVRNRVNGGSIRTVVAAGI